MASQAPSSTVLPRAVLRRSAAIEARFATPPAEPSPTPPAEPPAPVAPPPAAEAPPAAPPAPPVDPRKSDPAYWEHRFKVTEGLLNAKRTEHANDAQAKNQRIAELESQVATLQAGAPRSPESIDLSGIFTPEQIEKYGEEQCRVMASSAQAAAQAQVQKMIDAQLKPLADRQKAETEAAAAAKQATFVDKLIELVPNYAEIDVSPGWHAWLAQKDPSSKLQRQSILTHHVQHQHAEEVGEMFQRYLTESTPPPPPAPPVAPNGTGTPPADPPPAAPAPAGGKPSATEIRDFYKRAAINKVTDQERAAFEARLKL